jgi:hypothetical protein
LTCPCLTYKISSAKTKKSYDKPLLSRSHPWYFPLHLRTSWSPQRACRIISALGLDLGGRCLCCSAGRHRHGISIPWQMHALMLSVAWLFSYTLTMVRFQSLPHIYTPCSYAAVQHGSIHGQVCTCHVWAFFNCSIYFF